MENNIFHVKYIFQTINRLVEKLWVLQVIVKRLFAILILGVLTLPIVVSGISNSHDESIINSQEVQWWDSTSMDLDGDDVHDAIWKAIGSELYDWVDDDDTISVIVDFDHKPNFEDQLMLETEVDFRTQFRYNLIDSIAGRVEIT